MKKKYILINGVKHYIKEEDSEAAEGGDKPAEDAPVDPPVDPPAEGGDKPADADADADAKDIDAEATKIVNTIAASINEKLGGETKLKEVNEKVERLMKLYNPVDSKLSELLGGKEIDSNELTKDEKITGFYYACVTNNLSAVKALSEGVSADGGYLVPNEFAGEIIKELEDITIVRSVANVVPMKRKTKDYSSIVSGPEVYWTDEGAAKSTTTIHFGQPQLTAYKLAAIMYSTDELIEDAEDVDMVQLIIKQFALRIADKEDAAFAQGTGTGQPTGLTTAVGAGTIGGPTWDNGQSWFDNLKILKYSLAKVYRKRSKILLHSNNLLGLDKEKDNNGAYIWQENSSLDKPPTLVGRPYEELDELPEDEVYIGDFKWGYYWGDRKRISVLLSQHETTAFKEDKTAIRVVERVAGNVVWGNAIKCLQSIP